MSTLDKPSWLRCLRFAAVLPLASFLAASPATAGIDDSFDWKGKTRKLKVFYNFDAKANLDGANMKVIMDEALKNWNDAKGDTGWEFDPGGTAGDHQVEIRIDTIKGADGKQRNAGGATTTGFPGAGDKNREVERLKITFDPKPKEGFQWGVGDDKKLNPIRAAKHELSHTLRLDHQGGNGVDTGNIKDPTNARVKADDVTKLSKEDIAEAKKSSTLAIKAAAAKGGGGKNALSLSVPGYPFELPIPVKTADIKLEMPANASVNEVDVTLSRTATRSMPLPLDTPAGFGRFFTGAHIDATGSVSSGIPAPPIFTGIPFSLTIPYEDGVEGTGFQIHIADPDYGPMIENGLQPFYFDPGDQRWKTIGLIGGSFVLDTVDDFLLITLPSTALYQFPNLDDTNTGTLFISISGPIPEPHAAALLFLGLLVLGLVGRGRRTWGPRRDSG